MNEPLSRYNVTVTVGCDGGSCPDPAAFTLAADPGSMAPVRQHHQRAPG
jgi:hypothetical protein